MYYIYVLYSLRDGKFYVGKTTNLGERLKKHTKGEVRSTRNRRPLQLAYFEEFKEAKLAFLRERELKLPSAGTFKKELRDRLKLP